MVYLNGSFEPMPAIIVALYILLETLLVFIKRIRVWEKSKVWVCNNRIDFVYVVYDGYEADIEFGQRRKVRTYTVVDPDSVVVCGKKIVVKGKAFCVEEYYDSGTHKRNVKQISSFEIPPYFSDWDTAIMQFKAFSRS